jgi:hypothetical protein
MNQAQARPAPSVLGRRGFPLLWASLGLNAFLAAVCLSRLLHGGIGPAEPAAAQAPIARIVGALRPDDAARFRAALDARRGAITPARAAVSDAQARLAEAIRRTPFDPPGVRSALADWQANWQIFVVSFNAAVLAGLAELSDDGRARFADASLAEDARHVAAQRSYLEHGR